MKSTFRIENIDCPMCALKLEKALNRLPGVRSAVVDFTQQRLHLDAEDLERVQTTIARLEPGMALTALTAGVPASGDREASFDLRRELFVLGVAFLLFAGFLLAADWLRAHGWPGLYLLPALAAYLLAGLNVYRGALQTIRRGDFFDENVLMVIATAGALAIDAVAEAVAVMIFFKTGELLQNLAVARSRRSIRALLASRPDKAWRQTATGLEAVQPEAVQVGDTLLVRPGEKVPLDGEVLSGHTRLDPSALSGETLPQSARPGDTVLAGMINLEAALVLRVTRPFSESSIARVLSLVETAAARKAATEKFITTFARWYTPAVVVAALAVALLPPLLGADADLRTWIYRALVLLVISCPCALVISIPLGYFGGIGRASKNGILVKGSNYLDALARVKTVVFDKTGTLTRGRFELLEVVPRNGIDANTLLTYAALAEMHATHPIARSILAGVRETGLVLEEGAVSGHTVLPGRGVRATVFGRDVLVGNDALLHEQAIAHDGCEVAGSTAHVVIAGTYAGYLRLGDRVHPDAAAAVAGLRANGVHQVVMLTGDNPCSAAAVADELGLDAFHAGLLPEDKVVILEQLMLRTDEGGKVAFVGDGINDAPVIARSDVGVAMGALGSDAAIETADVVLMSDSPMQMVTAVRIARQTRTIVWQNIVMALAVKGVFVILGVLGVASMWEAVFADMGVALAAVFNATRALKA